MTDDIQPERPISDRSQDILQRQPFVERLTQTLINEGTGKATGITIGLSGSWGSGKSSILNLLRNHLADHKSRPVIVSFDPWLVSGRHDLISEFLRELVAEIRERVPDRRADVKELAQTVSRYASRLAPVVEMVPLIGKTAAGVTKAASTFLEVDRSLAKIRESLFTSLQTFPNPIIVLIDEVDRVEDDEIRTVAQLVRSVADFPGISYVLAYDALRVAEALGHGDRNRGLAYLEKIVQLQLPLPLMFSEERARMVEIELKRLVSELSLPKDFEHLPRYRERMAAMTNSLIGTPRDIKRLIGTFRALGGMVRGEVDWLDLLGYCALLTKDPGVVERIRNNVDSVVSNPLSITETIRRSNHDKYIEERQKIILGNNCDPAISEVLNVLFPSLQENAAAAEHSDPICERRPLLTVLRLGIVPGAWSRDRVLDVFRSQPSTISDLLTQLWANDELPSLFDRLDDVLHDNFAESSDFWLGVSDFLAKKDPQWLDHYVPRIGLTKDFADLLRRASQTGEAEKAAATSFLVMLDKANDIALVSELLRGHIFEYGLHGQKPRQRGNWFLSSADTESLANRVFSTWRQRHISGDFVNRIFDLGPVYAVQQGGFWDEECKARLDDVFDLDAGVDGFTLLAFGPEYVSEVSFLAQICDVSKYRDRIKGRVAKPALLHKLHESLQNALKRAADALGIE
jgi:hypothetical protein